MSDFYSTGNWRQCSAWRKIAAFFTFMFLLSGLSSVWADAGFWNDNAWGVAVSTGGSDFWVGGTTGVDANSCDAGGDYCHGWNTKSGDTFSLGTVSKLYLKRVKASTWSGESLYSRKVECYYKIDNGNESTVSLTANGTATANSNLGWCASMDVDLLSGLSAGNHVLYVRFKDDPCWSGDNCPGRYIPNTGNDQYSTGTWTWCEIPFSVVSSQQGGGDDDTSYSVVGLGDWYNCKPAMTETSSGVWEYSFTYDGNSEFYLTTDCNNKDTGKVDGSNGIKSDSKNVQSKDNGFGGYNIQITGFSNGDAIKIIYYANEGYVTVVYANPVTISIDADNSMGSVECYFGTGDSKTVVKNGDDISAYVGNTLNISATPADGYRVKSISVNGVEVTASYTSCIVGTENVTVSVVFEKDCKTASASTLTSEESTICSTGGSTTLTLAYSNNYMMYQLYNGDDAAVGAAVKGSGSSLSWTVGAGTYTVKAYDNSDSECAAAKLQIGEEVTVTGISAPTITPSATIVDQFAAVTFTSDVPVTWTVSSDPLTVSKSETKLVTKFVAAGSATVTATMKPDANNSCTATTDITVTKFADESCTSNN